MFSSPPCAFRFGLSAAFPLHIFLAYLLSAFFGRSPIYLLAFHLLLPLAVSSADCCFLHYCTFRFLLSSFACYSFCFFLAALPVALCLFRLVVDLFLCVLLLPPSQLLGGWRLSLQASFFRLVLFAVRMRCGEALRSHCLPFRAVLKGEPVCEPFRANQLQAAAIHPEVSIIM